MDRDCRLVSSVASNQLIALIALSKDPNAKIPILKILNPWIVEFAFFFYEYSRDQRTFARLPKYGRRDLKKNQQVLGYFNSHQIAELSNLRIIVFVISFRTIFSAFRIRRPTNQQFCASTWLFGRELKSAITI